MCKKRQWPYGVLIVQSFELVSASLIFQKPEAAPSIEKYFASASLGAGAKTLGTAPAHWSLVRVLKGLASESHWVETNLKSLISGSLILGIVYFFRLLARIC